MTDSASSAYTNQPAAICTLDDPKLKAAIAAFHAEQPLTSTALMPEESFTVANWNIQRIPFAGLMTPSYRKDRLTCMAAILAKEHFDVTAVQERFLSAPNTNHAYSTDDNHHSRFNWLRLRSKHHGLTLSSDMPMQHTVEGRYSQCGPNAADCFVKKGYIISDIQTANGPVTVVTTHMDAGDKPRDKAARISQLAELKQALLGYADRPMVLMGDLNFNNTDPQETIRLNTFLADLGLTINLREAGHGYEVIASRGLQQLATLEYDAPTLTDHRLEAVRFSLPRRPATVMAATGLAL
jgi:endonuclease/exonuclease/phosphatase family metal-dependent hydrolase